MNKDFFKKLLSCPKNYLKLYAYMYANSDDTGVFSQSISGMILNCQIPRSTLYRIIDFIKKCGHNVDTKRLNKELIVSIVIYKRRQQVDTKRSHNLITEPINFEDIKHCILTDDTWIKAVCGQLKMERKIVIYQLNEFFGEIYLKGIRNNLLKTKEHFINWAKSNKPISEMTKKPLYHNPPKPPSI